MNLDRVVESGVEDATDTYRWIPVCEEDQCSNIVAVFNPVANQGKYQEISDMVFSLSSSVLSFDTWYFREGGCAYQ